MAEELVPGVVFDIQGFSVHDGPGCRTLIFLKGCSMHCDWCANPEGRSPFPEPLWNKSKCTFDLLCLQACPANAIRLEAGHLHINRELCSQCTSYSCENACLTAAMKLAGMWMTVEEVFGRISRDRNYWGPGGGVTLTGGEPFVQPVFSSALLRRCYDAFIHTAAETCGNVPYHNIHDCLPFLEWIFFDLKLADETRLEKLSRGQGSAARILGNARRLAREFPGRLIFRLPLIRQVNDDPGNIKDIIRFMKETGKEEINILPGHHLGREKYSLLGLAYYTSDFTGHSPDELSRIRDDFARNDLACYIGSDTPF